MKKKITTLCILGFFVPWITSAHVKWFIDSTQPLQTQAMNVHFSFTQTAVQIWISIIFMSVFIAGILEYVIPASHPISQHLAQYKKYEHHIIRIFEVCIGIWLLVNTYQGVILAPHLQIHSLLMTISLVLQAAAAIFFLRGRIVYIGALFLFAVYILAVLQFGFVEMLDHIEVLGIVFFLGIHTAPKSLSPASLQTLQAWKVPLLRISAGITLMILALSEKLLQPQLSSAFLETHPWNFMSLLGIEWFSNPLFILSAGCSEFLFGVLFVTGVVTRLNSVALALFFIVTAVLLGPLEVIGHLPFFGMVLIFLVFGSGEQLTLSRVWKRSQHSA